MNTESFEVRHIGPRESEIEKMLSLINANSIDELIDQTIPESIRNTNEMKLDPPMSESDYLTHLKKISSLNKVYKTYIGMGYNRSYLPAVIQRNILENPGWYTAYTPYQAEIAQGRLEALLNFQTMVADGRRNYLPPADGTYSACCVGGQPYLILKKSTTSRHINF